LELKKLGESTLGGIDIWYDDITGKLNTDERGKKLGTFAGEYHLLAIYKDGSYELTNFELTHRFEPDNTLLLKKFDPEKVITAVYYDGNNKQHYVKRFHIETSTPDKRFNFITEARSSRLEIATTDPHPQVIVKIGLKGNQTEEKYFDLDMIVDVKGWKAIGNKLTNDKVKKITLVQNEPQPQKDTKTEDKSTLNGDIQSPSSSEGKSKNVNISALSEDVRTTGDQVEWKFNTKSSKSKDDSDETQLGLF
jgi:topoisomerase-4 subunit A